MSKDIMIKVKNLSKQYRLGTIGGTTLQEDLQRLGAKIFKKEDPTLKVGEAFEEMGKEFLALDGVSFEVRKGESVGIIGHNGAGKSTLLKLITRVTAPTDGMIGLNGRVASMLEVGTGFHSELTGRENIYMNGAILGMSRKEIDKKIEQIIDFSEVRLFIDTPVKRYSSGMYVKLGFAVAAHLDSEIVIMDEVLAVGDMAFQNKCLEKMRKAAKQEGRTVLYVSHNMKTIRQLCDRCIVLDHGKIIFDGDVDEGISIYCGNESKYQNKYIYDHTYHHLIPDEFIIRELEMLNGKPEGYEKGEQFQFKLLCSSKTEIKDVRFRLEIKNGSDSVIGTMLTENGINFHVEEKQIMMQFDTSHLASGLYYVDVVAYTLNEFGTERFLDGVYPGFSVEIKEDLDKENHIEWLHRYWGDIRLHDLEIIED